MEILYRGTPPEEREYISTCHSCKTRIKYKRSEAKYCPDQRDGDFLMIDCPICKKSISCAVSGYIKPTSVDPY